MIAFTREPSGSRASTSGEDSSMRRPTREMMRVDHEPEVRVVAERDRGGLELAEPLDVDLAVRVHQDVADFLVEQQRRDRPQVEGVVHQLRDQALLVGAREAHVASTISRRATRSTWERRSPSAEPSSWLRSSFAISSRWSRVFIAW
jgi:hypothetical protein